MRKVIERLLNLLAFLLTTDRPVSADEIRMTVAGYDQSSDEAFRRMFERDKDLLRQMGIPLEWRATDAWEVEFGYVIPSDRYEMPDPGLTDEERTALWLAGQIVRVGGQPSGPEAVLKLGGAPMAGGGEPLAADLGLAADLLGTVFQAVGESRELRFTYRGRTRRLHPYGMLHQRGHWYMVGPEQTAGGELRMFRVDRAGGFELGDKAGAFERPAGFSVRDASSGLPWEAGAEDITARVRFDPEVAWWALRQLPRTAEVVHENDGTVIADVSVANPDAFIGWILGFDAAAEIISPPPLRTLMIDRVRGVA